MCFTHNFPINRYRILYFPIAHNTLCLPPKFCINYCFGNMQTSQENLKTIVYAKFGGQTKCIMGNWKIVNSSTSDRESLLSTRLVLSSRLFSSLKLKNDRFPSAESNHSSQEKIPSNLVCICWLRCLVACAPINIPLKTDFRILMTSRENKEYILETLLVI